MITNVMFISEQTFPEYSEDTDSWPKSGNFRYGIE